MTALLIVLTTTGVYYLASRAVITQWLWSRYPTWLQKFTDCSACSGFWYGIGVSFWTQSLNLTLLGIPPDRWESYAIAGGVIGLVGTPIVAFLHTYAWSALSTGTDDDHGTDG